MVQDLSNGSLGLTALKHAGMTGLQTTIWTGASGPSQVMTQTSRGRVLRTLALILERLQTWFVLLHLDNLHHTFLEGQMKLRTTLFEI